MAPAATRTRKIKAPHFPPPSLDTQKEEEKAEENSSNFPPSLPFRKEKLVSFFSPFSLSLSFSRIQRLLLLLLLLFLSLPPFQLSLRERGRRGKKCPGIFFFFSFPFLVFVFVRPSSFARPLPSASGGSLFGRYRRRRSPFLAEEEEGGRLFSPAAASAFSLFKRPVA